MVNNKEVLPEGMVLGEDSDGTLIVDANALFANMGGVVMTTPDGKPLEEAVNTSILEKEETEPIPE